jgi:hypothetical protein
MHGNSERGTEQLIAEQRECLFKEDNNEETHVRCNSCLCHRVRPCKCLKITVTAGGNLVSIDRGTTSQVLFKNLISISGGIAEQTLWHVPHLRPNESRSRLKFKQYLI